MESFYYDRQEKLKPQQGTNQIGTTYLYGNNLIEAVDFAFKWLPLLEDLFLELDPIWYDHPNKLVRKRGLPQSKARTPRETLTELLGFMVKAQKPLSRGSNWGIPLHAWDKYNMVISEGFDRIGHSDCWDNQNYGLEVEFVEGAKPMAKTNQKNTFFNIADFIQPKKDEK